MVSGRGQRTELSVEFRLKLRVCGDFHGQRQQSPRLVVIPAFNQILGRLSMLSGQRVNGFPDLLRKPVSGVDVLVGPLLPFVECAFISQFGLAPMPGCKKGITFFFELFRRRAGKQFQERHRRLLLFILTFSGILRALLSVPHPFCRCLHKTEIRKSNSKKLAKVSLAGLYEPLKHIDVKN